MLRIEPLKLQDSLQQVLEKIKSNRQKWIPRNPHYFESKCQAEYETKQLNLVSKAVSAGADLLKMREALGVDGTQDNAFIQQIIAKSPTDANTKRFQKDFHLQKLKTSVEDAPYEVQNNLQGFTEQVVKRSFQAIKADASLAEIKMALLGSVYKADVLENFILNNLVRIIKEMNIAYATNFLQEYYLEQISVTGNKLRERIDRTKTLITFFGDAEIKESENQLKELIKNFEAAGGNRETAFALKTETDIAIIPLGTVGRLTLELELKTNPQNPQQSEMKPRN